MWNLMFIKFLQDRLVHVQCLRRQVFDTLHLVILIKDLSQRLYIMRFDSDTIPFRKTEAKRIMYKEKRRNAKS